MQIDVIGTRGFPVIEGGVEKHCEALYPQICKKVDVVVYRRRPYVKSAETSCKGVHFIDLPSTKIKGFEAVFHSFLATCSAIKRKPDIVHYHNIGPALFSPLLRLHSIPMVLTFHSPNYEHSKWGKFAKALLKLSEKIAINNACKVIFVNKYQMTRYSKDIQNKSVFIPNGVDEPLFVNQKKCLDMFGLEPKKYILSVGRITPEKGFDTLIKAFEAAGIAGYKLVIVGGVETEYGYKEQLDKLGKSLPIVFTGQLHGDELAQMYQNAALYVLASRNEGFPLTLLESMSYGLDVLVSDIPATRLVELREDDYSPVDDISAFANGISRKLKSPLSRKYDLSPFNWAQVAQKTMAVYKSVLGLG